MVHCFFQPLQQIVTVVFTNSNNNSKLLLIDNADRKDKNVLIWFIAIRSNKLSTAVAGDKCQCKDNIRRRHNQYPIDTVRRRSRLETVHPNWRQDMGAGLEEESN